MVVNGTSHVSITVKLDVAQQFLTYNSDLVTEIHYNQFLTDNGSVESYKVAYGRKRNSKGNFGSKLVHVGSWQWSDLGASREEIVAKINKEYDNVTRILGALV
jgi:hypothetical protein